MQITDDMIERAAIAAAHNSMRPNLPPTKEWPYQGSAYNKAAQQRWRNIARIMLEAAISPQT